MIVCNLTKPEATLEQVRKAFPKLAHTDAAQIAIAIVMSGKYAHAEYDGETFEYDKDVQKLQKQLTIQMKQIQQTVEPTKKAKAAAAEEEPIEIKVGLSVNLEKGESQLGDREDLKAILGKAAQEGLEFQYTGTDVLWQWALDRSNWTTITAGEMNRRVKLKAVFGDGTLGTELGIGGKVKKVAKAKPAAAVITEEEVPAAVAEVDTEETV
jgi:uncharacterized membrane protein YkoI